MSEAPPSVAPRGDWRRRLTVAVLVVLATIALSPGVASADPAKPTNYRSVVTSAHPSLPPGVNVKVVGGDGFLEVSSTGHDVEVFDARQPGQRQARPYLRIQRDGTVQLNRSSVGYFYNGTTVPMTHEIACQKARRAAEMAMQTILARTG